LFIVLASISSFAMAVTIIDIKGNSCGKWVETRKNNSSSQREAWIAGYLSGVAYESENNVFVSIDAESIYLWTDKYCAENPLNEVAVAAYNLFLELKYKPKN
jgi:hypothetical protein